ncbi:MAG TPA: hypothetical protein VFE58_15570 [Tepidisphaeraceae bacterium]|jgi:hypothetical protein|nr:hypothetical protein [Tepidisphaeraceae bacterium]
MKKAPLILPVMFLALIAARSRHAAAPRSSPSATPRPAPTTAPTSEVAKDQIALEQVEKRLRTTYEQGDDFQKADAAYKQTQTDYDTAVKAAIEKIKTNPEYTAAVDAKQKAEADQLAARTDNSTPDPATATKVMDARMAVHQLETNAGDADPAAKDAKAKLQAAKDAVNVLRSKFDQTMRTDPDYIAAKKTLDDARAQAHHA